MQMQRKFSLDSTFFPHAIFVRLSVLFFHRLQEMEHWKIVITISRHKYLFSRSFRSFLASFSPSISFCLPHSFAFPIQHSQISWVIWVGVCTVYLVHIDAMLGLYTLITRRKNVICRLFTILSSYSSFHLRILHRNFKCKTLATT